MVDKIKHAAEMLRDMAGTKVDLENASPECLDDMWTLAQAYLADHPPDDDETVTEKWLQQIGFTRDYDSQSIQNTYVRLSVWWKEPTQPIWYFALCQLPKWLITKRADVRRLCGSFGLELKTDTYQVKR